MAISNNEKDASFFANRAFCYLNLKKYNLCIEDCNKTLKIDSKFIKALKRKAKANFLLGNFDKSIEDFKEALKIDKYDKEVIQDLADMERTVKVLREAKELMKEEKYGQAYDKIDTVI